MMKLNNMNVKKKKYMMMEQKMKKNLNIKQVFKNYIKLNNHVQVATYQILRVSCMEVSLQDFG